MAGYNTTQNRKITSRATISALALVALAFCGMAAAEQLYVNESGWWRDGGTFNASGTPIQAAVDAADEGDAIYVWNGSYTDNVNVNKQLTLEGEGMDVVTVSMEDPDDHVFEVTADYVNLSGFTARGATDGNMAGIYLGNVDYCNISENNVYVNRYGIKLDSSSNNTLTSNNCSNNYDGIWLSSSSNNTLTSNNCSNNDHHGIYMGSSSNNTLTSNTVSDNRGTGIYLDSADNNNIACNLVRTNTKHGFYLTDGTTGSNISYNNIIENGNYNATSGGWEWQFYSAQHRPGEAEHNYWGAGMNSSTIDASIYDDMRAWDWEQVEFYPFETEPVPCAPTSEESHTFTTADAVIALQIAVGSRPFDSRLDVNGDNRVTSLDALMILQAAAGRIEID